VKPLLAILGLLLAAASFSAEDNTQGSVSGQNALCPKPSADADAGKQTLSADQFAALSRQPLPLHLLLNCPLNTPEQLPLNWLEQLLDAGISAELLDDTGRSALHVALQQLSRQPDLASFYQDSASLLLSRGAPSGLADYAGIRPLHLASAETDGRISGELLAMGADPLRRDNSGQHALDHALRYPDNSTTFALLLNTVAADLSDDDRELLVEALIQRQRVDLIATLLARFPSTKLDPVDASRALAVLLWQGARQDVAERFWQAGADAELVFSQGGGDLAWRLATLGHDDELDWLLAAGFPLNRLPESGFPPLFFANGHASAALLRRGAEVNLSSRSHGTVAAAFISPPAPFDEGGVSLDSSRLEQLLQAGLDPNRRDGQGLTALERALDADQLWLVQALLKAGADPTRAASGERSLLPKALASGRLPTIQSIIRALPKVADLHPLLLLDYVGSTQPDSAVVEALLVAGLSPNMAGAAGETALLRAARLQRWPLVSLLLRYGADADRLNEQGCSLHCYSWSMPESLQNTLRGGPAPSWQWPNISLHPSAFFALSLSPMLALWLATVAVALARRRPLWPALLWMFFSASAAMLISSALLYQCDPCLINDTAQQHYLSMALAAMLFILGPWRKGLRAIAAAPLSRAFYNDEADQQRTKNPTTTV